MSNSPPVVVLTVIVWLLKVAAVGVTPAIAEPEKSKAPTVVAGTENTAPEPDAIVDAGAHGISRLPGTQAPAEITKAAAGLEVTATPASKPSAVEAYRICFMAGPCAFIPAHATNMP